MKNHIFVIEWKVGSNGDQYVPIDYEDTLPAAEKVMEKYKSLNVMEWMPCVETEIVKTLMRNRLYMIIAANA
jgi:hypothetical protein